MHNMVALMFPFSLPLQLVPHTSLGKAVASSSTPGRRTTDPAHALTAWLWASAPL